VLPPTVTLQYHFMPQSRFSPYVGVGMTVAFFYDSRPSGPTVTKVGLTTRFKRIGRSALRVIAHHVM